MAEEVFWIGIVLTVVNVLYGLLNFSTFKKEDQSKRSTYHVCECSP